MQRDPRYWARAYAAADLVLSTERDKGKDALAELPKETLAQAADYFRLALERRQNKKAAK
jgi:hypothetical protein